VQNAAYREFDSKYNVSVLSISDDSVFSNHSRHFPSAHDRFNAIQNWIQTCHFLTTVASDIDRRPQEHEALLEIVRSCTTDTPIIPTSIPDDPEHL
jgi:hypothetical protein